MMLMSSTHHRFAGLFTIRRPGARPVTQLLVRGSDEETMAHLLMYSTDATELSEALTTTKSMVGRRLLECSDLSWEGCIEFWNPFGSNHRACHNIGFENECNNIVNGFKATWDAAKKTAVDAANAAKDVAVSAANEATALAMQQKR